MALYIHDYVTADRILFPATRSREETINAMLETVASAGLARDVDGFRKALLDREKLVSTGLGLGVAVPHAKLDSVGDFFVIVGILKHDVEWDAIDRKPVRLVFLIGGPANAQQVYLQILAKIVLVTKSPKLRESLLGARDAASVLRVLSGL